MDDIKIRPYGRIELAKLYFPQLTPKSAWRKLKGWMDFNPELRQILRESNQRTFTSNQVAKIVEMLGEP
jgi:prolyl-tRNA synthetase